MKLICKVCGAPSIRSLGKIEGYQVDTFFDVMECESCETKFTLPLEVDGKIYEAIYNNVDVVPGYARYSHYARQILRENDPLGYLMSREDCYWGIAKKILAETSKRKADDLILEIGSGQGYLTYALVKAGFNAIGLDISEAAVAKARLNYGDYFFCEDVSSFFLRTNKRPSFIILSEVIEHIPDPSSFISELLDYLQPGGTLIVTTPNKESCPSEVLWDTELPPVHLWWFTRKGLQTLGENLTCRVEFANLDEFYADNLRFANARHGSVYERKPIFDRDYSVIRGRAQEEAGGVTTALKNIAMRVLPKKLLRKIKQKKASLLGLEVCTAPASICVMYSPLPNRVSTSEEFREI